MMAKWLVSLSSRTYTWLLCLYPSEWRQKFGEEMHLVFTEAATVAAQQGGLGLFFWRELRDIPQSLAKVYWYDWTKKWRQGAQRLHEATSAADLPLPPPDGRDSWRQAVLELSPFLLAALLLLLATYRPLIALPPGWQRNMGFLEQIIVPLTLPIFLLGLARGLPRWAYPSGGLLTGYYALAANQFGLRPFLVVMLLATIILALVALATNPQPAPLPIPLRRVGQGLSVDWSRLSFAVYGALPLVIIIAFDDGYANNRTPYLALAVLVMVAGALLYSRSRQTLTQLGVLVGAMSLAIWTAWLDKLSFAGGLENWIMAPYPGAAALAWTMQLWLTWTFLILAPALLTTLSQAVRPKRMFSL
ncbi:MAG: hypothetical protein IT327_23630 [Anaerolineae bacterium]|nr:hypothetical protein [Anaerolineae bacterium]